MNHAVVIFGAEVHEVVIDGIHYLPFHMHLVVKVRTGTLSRITHAANHFAAHHTLAELRTEVSKMGLPRPVAESVVDDNGVAIAGFPTHLHHGSVACGIDVRTGIGREIHARMKTGRTINGVDAHAVA